MFDTEWQKLVGEQKGDLRILDLLVASVQRSALRATGGGEVLQVNLKQKKARSAKGFWYSWHSWLPNFFPRSNEQSDESAGAAAAAFASRRGGQRRVSETAFGWDMPVISTDPEEAGNIPLPGYEAAPGIAGIDWSHNRLLYMMSTFDSEFEPDSSSPITSLDQLYAQATLVRASLFPLVLKLAARNNGFFQLKVGLHNIPAWRIIVFCDLPLGHAIP